MGAACVCLWSGRDCQQKTALASQGEGQALARFLVGAVRHLQQQAKHSHANSFQILKDETAPPLAMHSETGLTEMSLLVASVQNSTENGRSVERSAFATSSIDAVGSSSPIHGTVHCIDTPSCSVLPASLLKTCACLTSPPLPTSWQVRRVAATRRPSCAKPPLPLSPLDSLEMGTSAKGADLEAGF